MLLRFAVENHRSIYERQELLFAASALKDFKDGLIDCKVVDSKAIVPAVVIYGANASGKTNFINALLRMSLMILWSQTKGEPTGGVPRRPYLLDPDCSEKPSCFEIDFVLNDIRYHYGFEATNEAFTSEWLYEIPKAHRRKLYERKEQDFDFGRELKGQNQTIAKLTRSNSLFLSAAAQNGHELLSRLYKYFQDIVFFNEISISGFKASSSVKEAGVDNRIINFLELINTGVIGYQKKEMKVPEESRISKRELNALFEKFSEGAIKFNSNDDEENI